METAVVSGYNAEDVLQEKTRTIDDHAGIWGLIELWFNQEPLIGTVKVSCYNSADVLLHEYLVSPIVPS